MKITKINFDVPFPSITWSDSSMVPLNSVSKHYVIEYKENLLKKLKEKSKILMEYEIEEIKNQLININKYLVLKMKLKQNNVLYSKDLSKIKESVSYFFKHENSTFEIKENTKIVEFNEFFKEVLFFKNDLYSNFKIENDILSVEITFSSPLNPFPYIEEIGEINNILVIHDLDTNWIALCDKSNFI